MQCGVVGIHARNASLSIREVFTKACQKVFQYKTLVEHLSVVPLLTCNRGELYFSAEDLAEAHGLILASLREEIPFAFENTLYSLFGLDCFSHLVQVTSGIDSIIVGETDIQGQVKKAYASAMQNHFLASEIHFLFQKALKVAKEVRNSHLFPKSKSSVEAMVVGLIKALNFCEKNPKVLLLGNSEINKKVIHCLKQAHITDLTLMTRVFDPMEKGSDLPVIGRGRIEEWVNFDIVIAATHSDDFLLKSGHLKSPRAQLLFDLSVPRTIDPFLGYLPHIHLFNIESIHSLLEKEKKLFENSIEETKTSIRQQVERQLQFYHRKSEKALTCSA